MKIVTLIENVVYKGGLYAEHGLSLYITAGNRKILFDTGQSGLFIQNAMQTGIDIADVDILVLSHSHYDHTGGLQSFLEINRKAVVLAKRDIFVPKYSGKTRFIGMNSSDLIKDGISFVDSVTELDTDVFILPNIDIHHPVDTNFRMLYKKVGNSFYPDDFADELFMVIRKNNSINIITACSHRGITNICTTAQNYFNLPVNMIIGGFHMKDCSTEQYLHIANYFRALKPSLIGVSHCTGIEKYAELKNDLASKVFYNFTGNEITIK